MSSSTTTTMRMNSIIDAVSLLAGSGDQRPRRRRGHKRCTSSQGRQHEAAYSSFGCTFCAFRSSAILKASSKLRSAHSRCSGTAILLFSLSQTE
jgi:hypothetical protein